MANVTMNVKVVNLFKTTAEWEQITDVITRGVLCVETTTDNKVKIKVGDGAKTYDALPYASEVDLSDYSTTTQMTQAINDAVAAYYTKTKVDELLANKVDTAEGKTLTSNDFTDELKTKLDGIAEGATAVTVDETLTDDGVNPVQGKAIKTALDDKVSTTDTLILNCTL